MDAAPARTEMDARRFRPLLELRRIDLEHRAAYRAITAASIAQDRPQQGGFQICIGLHLQDMCRRLGWRTRGASGAQASQSGI